MRAQQHWIKSLGWTGALMLLGLPAIAQTPNFGTLTLGNDKTSGTVSGSTGGSTSLPAIISNRDRKGNNCPGFGDPNPDHILELQKPFSKLTLTVASGTDTTLVVVGPGGVRCADDSKSGKDASLEDTDWGAGKYQVWIGTIEPNNKRNYRLSVQGN
jgi:hypothetical protein